MNSKTLVLIAFLMGAEQEGALAISNKLHHKAMEMETSDMELESIMNKYETKEKE